MTSASICSEGVPALVASSSAFMPAKATQLWSLLGAPGKLEDQRFANLESLDAAGWKVQKGEPLFPRAEKKPAP